MTPPAAVLEHEPWRGVVGEVVELHERGVLCSRCERQTFSPTFAGLTIDGARLPLWCCPLCASREVLR